LLAIAGWMLNDRLGGVVFFSAGQIGGFIMFCVVLGLAGSYAAMRKYLTMQSEM
jgi:hypothetical protein